MKTLRQINTIAFYTTLVLFLTLYLGMLAEIPLGIIQLISALILTFYKDKSITAVRQLTLYWVLVAFELALFLFEQFYFKSPGDYMGFTLIVFVPMGIATYFFFIMKKITNEYELNNLEP